jgi:hypothetical protein
MPPFTEDATPSPPASPTPRRITTQNGTAPPENQDVEMADEGPAPHHNPVTTVPAMPAKVTNQPRPLMLSRSEGSIPNAERSHATNISPLVARLEAAAQQDDPLTPQRGSTRNPLDKYMNAAMPTVHDASPTAILDLVDLRLIAKWETCPGEKLLAQPFDTISQDTSKHALLCRRILTTVVDVTQAKGATVLAPKPSAKAIRTRTTPSTFLIDNLTESQKQTLLSRYVWSSQAVTFRVLPLSPACPDFLFGIRDFTTLSETKVYEVVYNTWHDDTSNAFISSITDSVPNADRSAIEADLRIFIASMYVDLLATKESGEALTPQYNVYANGSVIHDDQIWKRVRAFFAERTYEDLLLGRATTVTLPFDCGLCHGVDHPRGLCRFPEIEGWNGPQHRPTADRADRMRRPNWK